MTALEAHQKAEENLNRATQAQFDEVMEEVETAVKNGKFSTTFYKTLNQETIDRLEKDPNRFTVKHISDYREGSYYEIYW